MDRHRTRRTELSVSPILAGANGLTVFEFWLFVSQAKVYEGQKRLVACCGSGRSDCPLRNGHEGHFRVLLLL